MTLSRSHPFSIVASLKWYGPPSSLATASGSRRAFRMAFLVSFQSVQHKKKLTISRNLFLGLGLRRYWDSITAPFDRSSDDKWLWNLFLAFKITAAFEITKVAAISRRLLEATWLNERFSLIVVAPKRTSECVTVVNTLARFIHRFQSWQLWHQLER